LRGLLRRLAGGEPRGVLDVLGEVRQLEDLADLDERVRVLGNALGPLDGLLAVLGLDDPVAADDLLASLNGPSVTPEAETRDASGRSPSAASSAPAFASSSL
jgi:hypothetical protein